jgi:hypothetical protein
MKTTNEQIYFVDKREEVRNDGEELNLSIT